MKYIGSREVSKMLGYELLSFRNKMMFQTGLVDIAYRFTKGGEYKWLISDIEQWAKTKRVKPDNDLTSKL